MSWVQFALFVLSVAYSYYTRPDPPSGPDDAIAAGIEDVSAPTAEDGKPVPVLFGRREIKSPNVIWYGDLKTDAMRENVGGGGKK